MKDPATNPETPSPGNLLRGAAGVEGFHSLPWRDRVRHIVDTMRDVSRQTDPQEMVRAYAARMRGTIAPGHILGLSRRGVRAPVVRLTRSSLWKQQPDPWRTPHALPTVQGGVLAEWLYSGEPVLHHDFVVPGHDPAHEYLRDARSVVAIPHFEDGEAVNMVVHTSPRAGAFDEERFPDLVLQSILFGRSTKNLVLARELREAFDALDAEIKSVQDMQMSLLPDRPNHLTSVDLATHYQTSTRAGGDYYDFFDLGPSSCGDRVAGVLVADVSGHGTPAAVLMAVVHAIAHLTPGEPAPPDRVLTFINRALTSRYTAKRGAFVTALYGIYDPATRVLSYANAGHPEPLVRDVDGTVRELAHPAGGLPLGILEDVTYECTTVRLEPGQAIALYTDGITEAFSPEKEMYGVERLKAAISAAPADASEIVARVVEDLGRFAGLDSRSDDRTLVVAVA
ncbi:MAG: PP2C family protein-serine/threonine phosphatase [Phycisphaerales bacterium]